MLEVVAAGVALVALPLVPELFDPLVELSDGESLDVLDDSVEEPADFDGFEARLSVL